MGLQKVGHNWATNTHRHTHTHIVKVPTDNCKWISVASLWTLELEFHIIFTCHEIFFFFSTPPLQKSKTTVNYKLAFTKSNANDWTIKAFAICLYGDWTPICYSCWPSTTPEGVQGGVRHSVLQGIWWDRSLDSWMFLGTDFMISIFASPHI